MNVLEWNPASGAMDSWRVAPMEDLEEAQRFNGMPWEGSSVPDQLSVDLPQENSGMQETVSSTTTPRVIPVPDSLTPSTQLPSSPLFRFSFHLPLHPLISTELHLGPRKWITGVMIISPIRSNANSASSGGIAGRIRKRFRKHDWQ